MDHEFSKPLAPVGSRRPDEGPSQQLSNSDFRKILMTPRTVSATPASSSRTPIPVPGSVRGFGSKQRISYETEKVEVVKKKKKYHHGESSKKPEDEILSDLAKRYRDRAKERRTHVEQSEFDMSVRAYQAVGPEHSYMNASEIRQEEIEKSKYLGGDMEHTHLVKGLDYVLLKKVRSEIQERENEEEKTKAVQRQVENELEQYKEPEEEKSSSNLENILDITFDASDRYAIKSKFAENILKTVFQSKEQNVSDLFQPGRMAWQYDLVTEFPETEVPVTIIRSKAECPNLDAYSSSNTNAIVIEKLIKIFTAFRASSNKKVKKVSRFDILPPEKEAEKTIKPIPNDDNIFDDLDEYVPNIERNKKPVKQSRFSDRPSRFSDRPSRFSDKPPVPESGKKHSYFGESNEEIPESSSPSNPGQSALELAAKVVTTLGSKKQSSQILNSARKTKLGMHEEEIDSYAECYPDAFRHDEAIYNSDDDDDDEDGGRKKKSGKKNTDTGERTKVPKSQNKQALERDLQKINAILASKKGQQQDAGHRHKDRE